MRSDSGAAPKHSALQAKADALFGLAHMTAVSSLQVVLGKFQSKALRTAVSVHGTNPWDFFVTAACIYVALSTLSDVTSSEGFDAYSAIHFSPAQQPNESPESALAPITDDLNRFKDVWQQRGESAVVDCSNFVKRALTGRPEEDQHGLAVALGTWVLWNVYQECPAEADSQLAGAIGNLAVTTFAFYWQ